MRLSAAQQTTFKTWLTNNASGLSDDAAANLANATAAPSYLVWKTRVERDVVQSAAAFDWTRVDNLSVGKARIWDWMFNRVDSFPPRQGNYRTGINAVWVGTQADLDVRAAVNGVCQRPCSNFEKLFVVVTGDGPTQSGSRGTVTNADQLGVDADGVVIDGAVVTAQYVAEVRG